MALFELNARAAAGAAFGPLFLAALFERAACGERAVALSPRDPDTFDRGAISSAEARAAAAALFLWLRRPFSKVAIAEPSSAGDFTVFTPAASSARNLSAAVPLPPATMAPA